MVGMVVQKWPAVFWHSLMSPISLRDISVLSPAERERVSVYTKITFFDTTCNLYLN